MSTADLLEALPEPHVVLQPVRAPDDVIVDFVYAAANPAACEFNMLPREELIGARLLAIHPNALESGIFDSYCRLIETGEPIELHDWGYAQDLLGGEWRYYDVRAVRSGGAVSQIWLDVTDRHHAVEALAASEDEARRRQAETQSIFDSQLDPFVRFSTVYDESGRAVDLRFVEANAAAGAYNQSTPEQMIGRTFLEFYPGLMENGPMADYLACAVDGTPVVLDDYAYPNEILGAERRYDIRAVQCTDGIALTWRDVTDRYRATEELAASEQRYRLLADNTSDVIWQVGEDGRVTWASESTHAVLGWTTDHVIGTVAADYVNLDDVSRALEARERVLAGTEIRQRFRVRRADGSYVWMGFMARPFETPGGAARIVALHDIDAEVAARDQLEKVLGRDPLTGLMTRSIMELAIEKAAPAQEASHVALICVGLDSLSVVNDAFGHAAGDVVLATTAARIVTEVTDPDVVGRGAGVDFLVLLTDEEAVHDAGALAERIRRAVKEPIQIGSRQITPTASVGIATDIATRDAGELIRAATLAMRAAKDAGRDRVAYATSDLADEAEQRVTVAASVAQALRAGEVTGWFQPVADLASGEIAGYEALARWVGADGVVREPAVFLPAVERIALIVDVDDAVMAKSLDVLTKLPATRFVSANVSARSLVTGGYVDRLLAGLETSGVDPSRLHLEVTETALLDVSGPVVAGMRRIADAGARWYVDDFGTGFSSISHLRDLPIRGLKLDLSFTAGIAEGDAQSIRLSQALAGLALGLGLDTIAEGIETPEVAAILSAQGWRLGQGWLYGRAAPL